MRIPFSASLRVAIPFALLIGGCSTKSLMDPSELSRRLQYEPGVRADQDSRTFTMAPAKSVPGSIGVNAEAPPPASPAAAPPPPADQPPAAPTEKRLVIYSGSFRVVVADVAASIRTVTQAAEQLGGYMQEVAGQSVTVRVPASKFDEAVGYVERTGEVVDRQLRASDVTEEMRDLNIRLDNAQKLRQRLQQILAKSDKVEDALKVEAELARVSEQIDQAKGRIRYLESQISLSTLRVDFNAAAKQNPNTQGPRLPFDWVEELGAGLVAGGFEQKTRQVGLFGRGPLFKTPDGFVRYYENTNHAEAMDGNGLLVRVEDHFNVDKAPIHFWSKLIRKSLVENRSLAVDKEETIDGKVYLLRGRRDVAGKPVGYLLSVERSDKRVIVFEAWGPMELFEKSAEALKTSAVSVEPGVK